VSRWRLRTSPGFDKAAHRLDRGVLRRVKTYLDAVCELDDPRQRGKGADRWPRRVLALPDW